MEIASEMEREIRRIFIECRTIIFNIAYFSYLDIFLYIYLLTNFFTICLLSHPMTDLLSYILLNFILFLRFHSLRSADLQVIESVKKVDDLYEKINRVQAVAADLPALILRYNYLSFV